jgi:hypothetical protein
MSNRRFLLALFAIVVFSVGLYALHSSTQNNRAAAAKFSLGQEANNGPSDVVLRVDSIERPDTVVDKSPTSGQEYVVLNITLKNKGSHVRSYKLNDFALISEKTRHAYVAEPARGLVGELKGAKISSGQSISGKLVFSLTHADAVNDTELQWKPSWQTKNIEVDLD